MNPLQTQSQIAQMARDIELLKGLVVELKSQTLNKPGNDQQEFIRNAVFNDRDVITSTTQIVTDSHGDTSTVPAAYTAYLVGTFRGKVVKVPFIGNL